MKITCDSPGPRVRADELVLAGLHQLLLDALGDLARDFIGGRARPQRAHHHRLEGEGRVFRLAQAAGTDQAPISASTQHRVEDERAVAQRPFGQIETRMVSAPCRTAVVAMRRSLLAASATGRLSRSTGATTWPSRSRWPPAATIQSSACSPDSTGTVVFAERRRGAPACSAACASPDRPPTPRSRRSAPRCIADSGTRSRGALRRRRCTYTRALWPSSTALAASPARSTRAA